MASDEVARDQVDLTLTPEGVTFSFGDKKHDVSIADAIERGDDEVLLRYGVMLQLSDVSKKLGILGLLVDKTQLVAASISTLAHNVQNPDPRRSVNVSLKTIQEYMAQLEAQGLKLPPEVKTAMVQAGVRAVSGAV